MRGPFHAKPPGTGSPCAASLKAIIDLVMPVVFVTALILLAGAFFAAMAEAMARTVPGVGGWFLSAHDVLYALWPGKLIRFEVAAESLDPRVWDPVLTGLLALPGWFLLGVPGALLFWWANPKRRTGNDEALDEDSLYLFDRLAERAERDGYADGTDDGAPSPFTQAPIDATLDEEPAAGGVPASPPGGEGSRGGRREDVS